MTRDAERRTSPLALAPGGTFSRSSRVRHRREFTRIQSAGIRARAHAFTVVALHQARTEARLGCAISKRVGNAVVRNRVRRLLREIFRRVSAELPPVDFVIIANPPAAELAFKGLEAVYSELGPILVEVGRKAEKRGPKR